MHLGTHNLFGEVVQRVLEAVIVCENGALEVGAGGHGIGFAKQSTRIYELDFNCQQDVRHDRTTIGSYTVRSTRAESSSREFGLAKLVVMATGVDYRGEMVS